MHEQPLGSRLNKRQMPVKLSHVVKFRLRRDGDPRIKAQVFIGPDKDHFQLAGELVLHVGEWQGIGCALMMGVERMVQQAPEATYIPFQIIVEGEAAALGREDELNGKPDVRVFPSLENDGGEHA